MAVEAEKQQFLPRRAFAFIGFHFLAKIVSLNSNTKFCAGSDPAKNCCPLVSSFRYVKRFLIKTRGIFSVKTMVRTGSLVHPVGYSFEWTSVVYPIALDQFEKQLVRICWIVVRFVPLCECSTNNTNLCLNENKLCERNKGRKFNLTLQADKCVPCLCSRV